MALVEQPIESHDVHSRRLIQHAEDMLEAGDRLQASEKAWGAVAHRLKVVADNRGWRYETHADSFVIARNLAVEQDSPRIMELFSIAHGLHINYYGDIKTTDYLRSEVENVKELLSILERIE